MLPSINYLKNLPKPSSDLSVTLISLETWILIKITGKDAMQCAQNQFTCDINQLKNKNQYKLTAHCNPQGKLISCMYVFFLNTHDIALIEPIQIAKKQISIMKKYSVFFDVNIIPNYNATLIGIAGKGTKEYLNIFFKTLPNQENTIMHYNGITVLYFNMPIERFLLVITDKELLNNLLYQANFLSVPHNNHYQWIALDIESGYPQIDLETSERFLPQSANIDTLGGISFEKGCYLGQELIARMQYRKLNKQSLYWLSSNVNQDEHLQLPKSGEYVQIKIRNQYWKNIGTVLQSCIIHNNNIWVQAILHNSTTKNDLLRIQNTQFQIIF